MNKKNRGPDFERSLEELERMVMALETGDLPLEESLQVFERAVKLSAECQSALKAAQTRVSVLMDRGGVSQLTPFADDAAGDEH